VKAEGFEIAKVTAPGRIHHCVKERYPGIDIAKALNNRVAFDADFRSVRRRERLRDCMIKARTLRSFHDGHGW
jgi:hypothetical protein